MKILVTGGAGYIGSACTKALCDKKYNVTVIDNLSTGNIKYVDKRAIFIKEDLLNEKSLFKKINDNYDILIHFVAHKNAGISMQDPILYSQNIQIMLNVLKLMIEKNIKKIIFSSTAAVYGDPIYVPVDELHPTNPANYYGFTKLVCEDLIKWYSNIYGIKYTILRYFNVAGDCGLNYIDNSANLFNVIKKVILKENKMLNIYGNDYKTRDGTCIRDYIHINDLIDAHILAINDQKNNIFNLGTKKGYTVNEVINEFEKQLNKKIPKKIIERRKGDIPILIASYQKAKKMLKWSPKYTLSDMVKSTLKNV